jgi:hypothetical protein
MLREELPNENILFVYIAHPFKNMHGKVCATAFLYCARDEVHRRRRHPPLDSFLSYEIMCAVAEFCVVFTQGLVGVSEMMYGFLQKIK